MCDIQWNSSCESRASAEVSTPFCSLWLTLYFSLCLVTFGLFLVLLQINLVKFPPPHLSIILMSCHLLWSRGPRVHKASTFVVEWHDQRKQSVITYQHCFTHFHPCSCCCANCKLFTGPQAQTDVVWCIFHFLFGADLAQTSVQTPGLKALNYKKQPCQSVKIIDLVLFVQIMRCMCGISVSTLTIWWRSIIFIITASRN